MSNVLQRIKEKAIALNKHIVLPEGEDSRVVRAAAQLPIFLELILGIIIGYVDQIQLSYDQNGVNAIGQTNTIVVLVNVTFQVLTTASIILITQLNGRKRYGESAKVYSLAFYFNLFASLIFTLILFFCSNIFFNIMGVDSEVLEKANLYMKITGSMVFLQAMIATFGSFLRANKHLKSTTTVSFIINILNIVGNSIAIYGIAKQDANSNLGIVGVAFSSTISRVIGLIVIVGMYIKFVKVPLNPFKLIKRFPKKLFRQLIVIGIPSAGETFSYQFSQVIILALINKFNNPTVSGNIRMYFSSVTSIIYLFANGIGQAAQIVNGELIGQKRKEEAYSLMKDVCIMAMTISFIFSILVLIVSYPVYSFLMRSSIAGGEILTIWGTQLSIPIVCVIISAIDIVLDQGRAINIVLVKGLQTSGDIFVPVLTAIISCWSIAVFGTYIFGNLLGLGIIGVIIANTLDECFRGAFFLVRLRSKKWMKKDIIKSSAIGDNMSVTISDEFVPLEEIEPFSPSTVETTVISQSNINKETITSNVNSNDSY